MKSAPTRWLAWFGGCRQEPRLSAPHRGYRIKSGKSVVVVAGVACRLSVVDVLRAHHSAPPWETFA